MIADFGLSTLLIREISRNKKEVKKYLSNAFIIKIFLSMLTFLLTFMYLNLLDYSSDIKILTYTLVIFMILQSFTDLFYSVFRAFEKMHYDAAIKVFRMIILSSLVFYFMYGDHELSLVVMMFPLTEIIILSSSIWIYLKNFAGLDFKPDLEFIKNLLKKSSLFCLSFVFMGLLLYIDTIMLQRMRGSAEVGIYAAAYNLLLGITFIPLMYSNSVFPVFSRYFIKNKKLLGFAYKKSFKYMLILGLPVSIGIYMYSQNIISLVYGSTGYGDSIIALQILCWFVGLRFVNTLSGTLLSSMNRQGSRVFSQGIVTLANIVLNIILIPKLGFVGAGIATVISESLFLIFYGYFIFKLGMFSGILKVMIKPIFSGIVMALSIMGIQDLLIGTIVGALAYMMTLVLTRTFNHEDKKLAIRILKNK